MLLMIPRHFPNRQVFSDEASLDRSIARRISDEAANPRPKVLNHVSIATADPCAGPIAVALLSEMVPYDYDPTDTLAAQIAVLNLSATKNDSPLKTSNSYSLSPTTSRSFRTLSYKPLTCAPATKPSP